MGVDRSVGSIRRWLEAAGPWLLLGLLIGLTALLGAVLIESTTARTADRYRECRTEHSVGRCIEAALLGADPDSLAGGGP